MRKGHKSKEKGSRRTGTKGTASAINHEEVYVQLMQKIAHNIQAPKYSLRTSGCSSIAALMTEMYESALKNRPATSRALFAMLRKLDRVDERTLVLTSAVEKLEADVDVLKKKPGDVEIERDWPSYASEDFQNIIENAQGLDNTNDDESEILYYLMEMETLLRSMEKKARVIGRKYEARLAASLLDICRVHEPGDISLEQKERFTACVRALVEGWGKLNRDKVNWIRSRLLQVGLTWLPVTKKAKKDISKAEVSAK